MDCQYEVLLEILFSEKPATLVKMLISLGLTIAFTISTTRQLIVLIFGFLYYFVFQSVQT